MSLEYFYESLGKWVKDCPFNFKKLSTLIEGYPCVGKCWDVAHTSWQVTLSKEICLHLSLFLYDLMKQCSLYLYVGADLSQTIEKLHDFIKKFLVDDSCLKGMLCRTDKRCREVLGSLINAARKWSILTKDYSHVWSFLKELAQRKTTDGANDAVIKIQSVCKDTAEYASLQIDALTKEFVEKTENIITGMSDLFKDSKILQASAIVSSKLIDLLGYILELFDFFLEYLTSLVAFDFDIPLEMGWAQIEEDELVILVNAMGLDVRKKRRFVGQH